ncbi:MAG: Mth938-like domain-containing protein [Candidatus Thiodiazotropha sp. (ex Dulcina madagascariensis)]|nr:Mth938-like domain-containing protein [Candidatus Thiodiazotropha sp. (ex Dulcina madagascariensis)]MCU7926448.1 Mth938-like domain-containing protein [Candidatus Thiodiazotropha sp. (ex Dulcina madagascariensis)]
MKFILDDADAGHAIQRYCEGEIVINDVIYRQSLVILPDRIIAEWRPGSYQELLQDDFSRLAELTPEIVVLGTGAKQRFPQPALTQPLIESRIGLEVMDTAAACRTYNILMSEGRRVAAALIMI